MKALLPIIVVLCVFSAGCIDFVDDVSDYFFTETVTDKPVGGPCDYASDCNTWEFCDAHLCRAKAGYCTSVDDCDDWETCNAARRCEMKPSRCNIDGDCPLARPTCDRDHYCNR
jgi:hypothetical protein